MSLMYFKRIGGCLNSQVLFHTYIHVAPYANKRRRNVRAIYYLARLFRITISPEKKYQFISQKVLYI